MDNKNIKTTKDLLTEAIYKIVGFMDLECQVEIKEDVDERARKSVLVSIYTPEDAKLLIGKNGDNLKSLEHVLRAMFLKKIVDFNNIIVDVNDYKKSRSSYLVETAQQAVMRVRNTQKAEALFPMSSYERRVVHMELAACPDIATESIGAEPNRRIVIKPYP